MGISWLLGEFSQVGGTSAHRAADPGSRGHVEGLFLLVATGIVGAPAPADKLDTYVSCSLAAVQPWVIIAAT